MTDKKSILIKVQQYYGFKKGAEFAKFLEISPQVLANWKSRNTFDPVIVYTKCVDVNPHWLLLGEGEMVKEISNEDSSINQVNCHICVEKEKIIKQQKETIGALKEVIEQIKERLKEKE